MQVAEPKVRPKVDQLRRLYGFMAERSFVASRRELTAAGFSTHRIANWNRNGRLVKLLRGVYSYGRDVETEVSVWRAGLLAAGRGSALTGVSACELWGMVQRTSRLPRRVVIGISSGQTRELRGQSPALRRTTFSLVRRKYKASDLRSRNRLAVVSPVLALVDYASEASSREVRFAFLEACRLGLFGRSEVEDCYKRIVGRRGTGKIRPLLALWVPELNRIRSVFEGLFLLAWIHRGYRMPKVNETLFGFQVDFYWPEHDLVLETDGGAYHNNPAQQAIDVAKQRALEAQGLTVLRMSYRDFSQRPAEEIERVHGVLARP